jgi:flagellar basal-body rod protein FlgC
MSADAFTIAASGLRAAEARLEASASNIANMSSSGPLPGTPVDPTLPPASVYRPVRAVSVDQGAGGAPGGAAVRFVQESPGYTAAYEPSNPYADERGMVAMPSVDLPTEIVEQVSASIQFQAALKVMKVASDMLKTTVDRTA